MREEIAVKTLRVQFRTGNNYVEGKAPDRTKRTEGRETMDDNRAVAKPNKVTLKFVALMRIVTHVT